MIIIEAYTRTDLAMEAHELWRVNEDRCSDYSGVKSKTERIQGFSLTTVEILDENAARELSKPIGKYITFELDALMKREENSFVDAVGILAAQLSDIISDTDGDVMIVGLGNEAITPDAIGPKALESVLATRHLKQQMPTEFLSFRSVSLIEAGVLGTTGVESAELVKAIVDRIKPSLVIAIDALASCKTERLCRTVQIADTGIVPGSGIGNSRLALNHESLGVPVIAVGVPTVVDAMTIISEYISGKGLDLPDLDEKNAMIVTPRDIDKNVHDISKLIGYAINVALHKGLTVADVDMFL
ncbi:GPR endopeptidase [Clostridiaceae bacterium OttesenSCG-928-D20]|nr:GPR endopeptidase [Clostridiaceae bacterium OttesenSCG-928-D20]